MSEATQKNEAGNVSAADCKKQAEKAHDKSVLRTLLRKNQSRLTLRNSPDCRRLNAATVCATRLLERTPEKCRALITITTKQKDARRVSKAISKITAKHLMPEVRDFVACLHRTGNAFLHLHLLAALRYPVLIRGTPCAAQRYAQRRAFEELRTGCPWMKRTKYPLSDEAKRLEKSLSNAIKRIGLGYMVKVEAVDDTDAVVRYVMRYMEGVARHGIRYRHDKGARLWSATKAARVVSQQHHIICRGERLRRFKLAAYCASRGCFTMEAMKAKFGSKWQYHARETLNGLLLRVYPTEEDFVSDWRQRWSPEALGVHILDPKYSASARAYSYECESVEPADVDGVRRLLEGALDVPEAVRLSAG